MGGEQAEEDKAEQQEGCVPLRKSEKAESGSLCPANLKE